MAPLSSRSRCRCFGSRPPIGWVDRLVGFAIESPVDLTLEFHDEYGWREQVATLARVRDTLASEERVACKILAWNYGETAAINVFGPTCRLPRAVSGNMSYFLWGPGPETQPVLAFGMQRGELERLFADVREVARVGHPLAVPSEKDLPVYLCRNANHSLQTAWPSLLVQRRHGRHNDQRLSSGQVPAVLPGEIHRRSRRRSRFARATR